MSTIVITGANSGVGLATAQNLAKQNDLILFVRSESKALETKAAILKVTPNAKVDYVIGDLADLASVKKAADAIKSKVNVIDRLINNAGYSPVGITFTPDGYEKSFVANHLGHFVLTLNLLDQLKKSSEARVINVASDGHALGKVERFFLKNNTKISDMGAYCDGKLANILFTKGLVKHTKGTSITTYSLHPGVVNTNWGAGMKGILGWGMSLFRPFMITPEKGAATSIYLATTDLKNIAPLNGTYFSKSKPAKIKNSGVTDKNVDWVWEKSLEASKGLI